MVDDTPQNSAKLKIALLDELKELINESNVASTTEPIVESSSDTDTENQLIEIEKHLNQLNEDEETKEKPADTVQVTTRLSQDIKARLRQKLLDKNQSVSLKPSGIQSKL